MLSTIKRNKRNYCIPWSYISTLIKIFPHISFHSFNYFIPFKYKNIIFCSDSNIAHTENDVSNPSEAITKTGFLPLEQQAFSKLLSFGFVDSYREIHGKEKAYTWRSYKEILYKQSGMKYRFDYIITNIELQQKLKESNILDLPFSDHLPVANDYDFDL